MSRHELPRHKAGTSPKRLLAAVSAATLTLLAVSGALGVGPAASLGAAPPHKAAGLHNAAAHDTADDTTSDDAVAPDEDVVDPSDSGQTDNAQTDPGDSADSGDDVAALPAHSGDGRRIVYDISDQRVWLVNKHDTVIRTYLVSGSRYDQVVPDTYAVYSMSRYASSYDGGADTMNYMVRFTQGENAAIGFHDIPRVVDTGDLIQTKSELGTPLSAGCIRQWKPDAKALWKFASVGTTVVVTR